MREFFLLGTVPVNVYITCIYKAIMFVFIVKSKAFVIYFTKNNGRSIIVVVHSSENKNMKSDEKERTSNKTEETNEIRITLEADHPVVTGGEDPEIAEITVKIPEKYRDFNVTGISHVKNGVSYEDVFGVDRSIVMNDWFQPIFSSRMRDLLYEDFRDLLDISLVNQKQNDKMFKLLSNSVYRRAEDDRERSERIHSTKKPVAETISATIASK